MTTTESEAVQKLAAAPSAARLRTQAHFQTVELAAQLDQAVANSPTLPELLKNLAGIVCDQADCLAMWFSVPNESGQFVEFRVVLDRDDNSVWPIVEELTREIAPAAAQSRQLCHANFQPNAQLLVAPVCSGAGEAATCQAMWVGCFSTEDQTAIRQHWLMNAVTQATVVWLAQRSEARFTSQSKQLSDLLATITAMGRTQRVSQAATVLCNHLRKHLAVDQVALSLPVPSSGSLGNNVTMRLTSVSDVEQVDHASESNKLLAQACSAAMRAGHLVAFPFEESADGQPVNLSEQKSLQQYCQAERVAACVSLPLRNCDGFIIATILVTTTAERVTDPNSLEQLAQTTNLLGQHFDTVVRANRSTQEVLSSQLRRIRSANWTRYGLIASALVAALMCLPLPYRIACDCTIQPVKRRYVAAPYDGILDRAHVKKGDLVEANAVVADMDEGNLRIELSAVEAELAAARKRRDSALALGEVAKSQIARSEMRRHQAEIELLQQQLTNLEIRSPIDGLVVAGDLEKAEGAPLEMGQTVFEIAPLDRMVAEIAIDESEIPYARPGMDVSIKLNAFPFRKWQGTVQSISPSTEIVKDDSVFIAEVEIVNAEMLLKPGMEGSAKIVADRAPLGWSLFHRPYESLRYWMIW